MQKLPVITTISNKADSVGILSRRFIWQMAGNAKARNSASNDCRDILNSKR